jgi:hypothetical protein
MKKETIAEIENKIRRYYQKDKLIESLKKRLKLLDEQIKVIEEDLKNCNVTIEPNIKAISYEERVQTSGDGTSYAEREVMRVTEFKIKRKAEKQLEKEKILEQIDNIELDYNFISDSINLFDDKLKKILRMKYKDNMGEEAIGLELHLAQSAINIKKNDMLRKIENFNMWGNIS